MTLFQDKGGNFCIEEGQTASIPSGNSAFSTPKHSAPSSVTLQENVTPTLSIAGSSFQMTPEMLTLLSTLTGGGLPIDSSLVDAAYSSPRANLLQGVAPANTSFGSAAWGSTPGLQASTNILQQAALDANIPQQASPFGQQVWNVPPSTESSPYLQPQYGMGMGMMQGVPATSSPSLLQAPLGGMMPGVSGPQSIQGGMAVSAAPATGMVQAVSAQQSVTLPGVMQVSMAGSPSTGMVSTVSRPQSLAVPSLAVSAAAPTVSGTQSVNITGSGGSAALAAGTVPTVSDPQSVARGSAAPASMVPPVSSVSGNPAHAIPSTPGDFISTQSSTKETAEASRQLQKDDETVTRESPDNQLMPFAVWKTLVNDRLVITGLKVDVVFTNLSIIEDVVTDEGVLRGYFVRGLAHKVVKIGGFVKCSAGRMGWRTMEYQKFVDCCNISERGAKKTKNPSAGDPGAEKHVDKYVSTPFNDPAFNIEYRNLCAANATLRSEQRCFCRLAGR